MRLASAFSEGDLNHIARQAISQLKIPHVCIMCSRVCVSDQAMINEVVMNDGALTYCRMKISMYTTIKNEWLFIVPGSL